MREISLHILDLIQNSITAGASEIAINIQEDRQEDIFTLEIIDNGRGMSGEILAKATDPFQTSRQTREVGLGLSLLEAAAGRCGGRLKLSSAPGKGTRVEASFSFNHLDRAPLGDITATIVSVLALNEGLDISYHHNTAAGDFYFNSVEIRRELGGIKINHPRILEWLEGFLNEGLESVQQNVEVSQI